MIYLHVPICKSFCVYCDFYSEIACSNAKALEAYTEKVVEEIRERSEQILSTQKVNTLYIGGGTPSVMPLPFFESVLKALPLKDFSEFTVEVNPDDIVHRGREFTDALKKMGVSRISMGVQSLSDDILRWMRRRHDAATALQAFKILRDSGFDNISLDLIFGVDGLSDKILTDTLGQFLRLHPEHISAYQLSIEEGSALDKMVLRGQYTPLPDEQCAHQYELICGSLRSAGYRHYEISNWALPGKEAVHNSAYWDREPYVGLGPGAHSFLIKPDGTQERSWNSEGLADWHSEKEVLSAKEIREESIMLGLRKQEGITLDGRHLSIPEDKWFISDSIIEEMI